MTGNAATLPGTVAIYDVSQDCRHPGLRSQLASSNGHESGFSPDGNTFWAGGAAGYIRAIDVADPGAPREIWTGAYYSHGLNLSDDGNTLYQTDPVNGNLGILDVSEVQARKADPKVREISRLTWDTVSIPQNSVPLSIKGKRYLFEFDEFAFRFNPATVDNKVGAARLIDLSRPDRPRIASNLRLEVNQQANHAAVEGDPTALPDANTALGYSAHYCAAPRRVDPGIVACSFLNSGLRVFDVRDPEDPREVAYFLAPPNAGKVPGFLPGNLAFSQPAFDPQRRTVWYTDASSGFYAVKLSAAAWPADAKAPPCLARRSSIGPNHIGRIRLGVTRARMRRVPVRAPRRSARTYRYCVKQASGGVTAAFSSKARRGKATLITTTAKGSGNRRATVGTSGRALPQGLPQPRPRRPRPLPPRPRQHPHRRHPQGPRPLLRRHLQGRHPPAGADAAVPARGGPALKPPQRSADTGGMVTIAVCLLAFLLLGYALGRSRWPTLVPSALALYILLGTFFEGVEDACAWLYFLGVASACLVAGLVGVMLRDRSQESPSSAS